MRPLPLPLLLLLSCLAVTTAAEEDFEETESTGDGSKQQYKISMPDWGKNIISDIGDSMQGPAKQAPCKGKHTDREREHVWRTHNMYRSKIARGMYKATNFTNSLPAATNMRKMYYECSLENSAQKKADECDFAHTKVVPGTGENLAMFQIPTGMGSEGVMTRAVNDWVDEWDDYGYPADLKPTTGGATLRKLRGHAIQMTATSTFRVGCAFANCSTMKDSDSTQSMITRPGFNQFLIVCHYKKPFDESKAMYKDGVVCSDCPPRMHCERSSGLCKWSSPAAVSAVSLPLFLLLLLL